ncbi:DUF2285 domain-containing protein [Ramlibacter sp. G-1-2-2]|uniref:DUF2285 domain-containing protein n=1 Tax=Ramlibacter agri TaxID=2728837 RepID=A0A848H1Y4_9BURK|nr:DUF2285 domain-containing protein [Ramlibacter agri]NML43519.1 DUF2285 domain-containing protein [Ramlibacter agri]
MEMRPSGSTEPFLRPSWRDAAAYAALQTASLVRVAWEFLRRNPAYQEAWGALKDYAATLESRDPQLVLQEFGDDLPHVLLRASVERAQQWGLNVMVDPSSNGGSFVFASAGWDYTLVDKGTGIPETADNPHGLQKNTKWLVAKVDLSLPLNVIESQLLAAVRAERQARIKRGVFEPIESRAQNTDRYVEYLRILDADAAGASVKEIGDALAPMAANDEDRQRDKRFRAALKEAQRLQQEGYRVLPLLQPAAPRKKN